MKLAAVSLGALLGPDTVMHVVAHDEERGVPGGWADAATARCGAVVDATCPVRARSVPAEARCARNGCRQHWPALLRLVG